MIVFRHLLCPGDLTVMSALVRDYYRATGELCCVQTPHSEGIWDSNPFVVHAFVPDDTVPSDYRVVNLHYKVSNDENDKQHFLQAFHADASRQLGIDIPLTEFRPCLVLSKDEKRVRPIKEPYWLINAGGKWDFTTKWWDPDKWQRVIKLLHRPDFPRIYQVGYTEYCQHPGLSGVHSLVDKTTLRELVRTIYHARGVICGVTATMHIAAAFSKPCVVVAGGREAWWWDSYSREAFNAIYPTIPEKYAPLAEQLTHHVFLHSIGKYDCCRYRGCWKMGIWENRDKTKNCVQHLPVRAGKRSIPQPRCMDEIKAEQVAGAALGYERALVANQ